jgi:hypothetical protein
MEIVALPHNQFTYKRRTRETDFRLPGIIV